MQSSTDGAYTNLQSSGLISITQMPSLPAPAVFYTEEFDTNLDGWTFFMRSGKDTSEFSYALIDGKLAVRIIPQGDEPWGYLINQSGSYNDVQLEVVTTNNGNNSNGVSLICRFSDQGWYEFWISNIGTYGIYAFGPGGTILQDGFELSTGGTPAIRPNRAENTFMATCKGEDLILTINGTAMAAVKAKYDFTEGSIGIGVSAFQNNPIDLEIESLKISQPSGSTATQTTTETLTPTPNVHLPEITSRGAVMVLVPAGIFQMGAVRGDLFAEAHEKPNHTVELDAYYIDKFEVTNALYQACVEAGACKPPIQTNSLTHSKYYGNPSFDNYPVIYVDWNMANAYCEWRRGKIAHRSRMGKSR